MPASVVRHRQTPPPSTVSAVAIGTTMPTIDATTVTSRINRVIMLRPPVLNVHRVVHITMTIPIRGMSATAASIQHTPKHGL